MNISFKGAFQRIKAFDVYQGEHNKTELTFTLPSNFTGADYVNVEFNRSDNEKMVVDGLVPENGTVTVRLTQSMTAAIGALEVQLVAYKVEGGEVREIAKSPIVKGLVNRSIEATEPADVEPSLIEKIQAFISDAREKLADAWEKRHTHANKATLDELYCQNAEDPPETPGIYIHGENYLHFFGKALRYTRDGGVIDRVTTTTKQGKKYLRLTLNWEPDLYLDLEAGRSAAGRPMQVDIPVEDVDSQQGGDTLELNLGVNSINEEIIGIQEELSVLPDWDENDPSSRAYIANRTHWNEESTVTNTFTFTSIYDEDKDRYSWRYDGEGEFIFPLQAQKTYNIIINDVTYHCQSSILYESEDHDSYEIGIGKLSLHPDYEGEEQSDCPILIVYSYGEEKGSQYEECVLYSVQALEGSTITFSVEANSIVYHKLSPNYLPDDVIEAVWMKHAHNNKAVLDDLGSTTITGAIKVATYETRPINGVRSMDILTDGYNGTIYAGVPLVFGTSQTQSIVISSFTNNALYFYPEYVLEFTTGATAPTLTLPAAVEWADELTVEANKHYQISIVNNIALWCAVDVEVEE